MAKPRAENSVRSLSYFWVVIPGVLRSASATLVTPRSSICWRVTTVTDCGVSRMVSGSLVAVVVAPVV
ncbi:hypothetical protein D3C76_807180 [compost metagenome]